MTQNVNNSRRNFLVGAFTVVGTTVLTGCSNNKHKTECPPLKECPPEKPCVCPTPPTTETSKPPAPSNFKPWVGKMPRSEIKWGPTVDPEKCIGCAVCINCGPKVFELIDNKPVVKNYDKCMPGCTTCKNLCPAEAISFPDLQPLKDALIKHKVYENMKTWLQEAGKLPKA